MSTPNRPLPGHGTRARFQRGCDCGPCTQANYRFMAAYRLEQHRGQRRRVPSGPALQHARALIAAGWIQAQISRAGGVSDRAVSDLMAGNPRIHRTTANAILAIPIGPPPRGRDIDATGTRRRLQALAVIGHTMVSIADEVGLARGAVIRIANGEFPSVRATTADAIADLYRSWVQRPGPSKRTSTIATRRGWHSPIAWDGDDIDDPCAMPDTGADDEPLTQAEARAINGQEMQHLASLGVAEHDIARRLGLRERHVHDTLRQLREAA
ncbi:hypothetical protein ACWGIB_27600 [Streptomyces xiamenensis]